MGAGYQTLSGEPEILSHCVLTMTEVPEIEMGNLLWVILCSVEKLSKGEKSQS